jgi:hypothetical protein
MMRVSFSSAATARAAVKVLEAYGYSADQCGRDVVTDCPPLLAVPAFHKRIGFSEIERLDLAVRRQTPGAMAEFSPYGDAATAEPDKQMSA